MLDLESFCSTVGNACKLRTILTSNLYTVSYNGRRYSVTIKACGRYIYRIACDSVITDMPPLKSRKMISTVLAGTMRLLFEAVDARRVGVLELPCKVPQSVLETRYDHWAVILEHEAQEVQDAAEWAAGAEERQLAYMAGVRAKRRLNGPGATGMYRFSQLAKKHGVKFEYVAGSYDQKTKTVTPCEVKLTAQVGQIWACQSDVTVIRGQSHRAGTDWLYLRTCLYNELDGMHEPKFVFDRSKYTV